MADNSKQIDDIINSTFNQLKNIVDANTVIGKTIKINEDIFIIPVDVIEKYKSSIALSTAEPWKNNFEQLTNNSST